MSLQSTTIRTSYSGNGSSTNFSFPYNFLDSDDLTVLLVDTTDDSEVLQVITTNYTVSGAGVEGGGTVTFLVAPPSGQKVVITREPDITQTFDPEVIGPVPPDTVEREFDRRTMVEQWIAFMLSRGIRIPDGFTGAFNPTLPADFAADDVLVINSTRDGFDAISAAAVTAAAGSGLPPGGADGAVLSKISAADADADWIQYAYSGFSSRFGATFTSTDLDDTLAKIIAITYAAPTISLSASGSGTIREKGDPVTSSTLTASVTKKSDPIKEVRFYLNPSTLLDTQTSGGAIPAGGNSTYNWTGSFSDNTTFRAAVDDDGATGGPTTVSATSSFTFVYPYYYGAGAVGLSAAAVAALTKNIISSTATKVVSLTAGAGQVFYFAYPASYGALTSILDVNNFETIGDWTLTTTNITGLDASAQSYRIYEFKNPVTAGAYQYTFKR